MKKIIHLLLTITVIGFSFPTSAMECDVQDGALFQRIYKAATEMAKPNKYYDHDLTPDKNNCEFVGRLTTGPGRDEESFYFRANVNESGINITSSNRDEFTAASEYFLSHRFEYNKELREKERKAQEERSRKAWAEQERMAREGDIAGLMGVKDPKKKAGINKDPFGKDVRDMVQNICRDITRQQMSQGNTGNICTMAFPVRVLGNNNYIAQMQVGENIVRVRFDMSGNYEEIH